ncbi:uncharacterized protein [Takifugu rubripes]|uniref:uncharacterized protein n=1 Tax=Takifugu rubripes TaxID=31033 RepID=UPI001145B311|nr:myb/SANT-like DNA-binding domain-containing protein 4 [Takifugu rubripes]
MSHELVESKSERKRRSNWTEQESLLLAQLVQEKKNIIRGKCSTGVSTLDKRNAWEHIAQNINTTFPHVQRTVSDCNKKWENLLAKTREEIKRQKRLVGADGMSLENFSAVTQIVISVMNLSGVLQEVNDSAAALLESQQKSCNEDGGEDTMRETFSNKHPLVELEHHTYTAASTSTAKPNITLTNVPKSLALQFSTGFSAPDDELASPCPTSAPCPHCPSSQERVDLEMSVLRRQDAVLKLQEEYYTLKLEMIKKKMKAPFSED